MNLKFSSVVFFAMLTVPPLSFAAVNAGEPYMRCGDFVFSTSKTDDGWTRINGAKPESQKVTFLKAKDDYRNIKMEWRVATNQPGKWIGLEYIKRDGKGILNAQLLQASMDAPRQYATYDCVKIK